MINKTYSWFSTSNSLRERHCAATFTVAVHHLARRRCAAGASRYQAWFLVQHVEPTARYTELIK